MQGGGRRPAGRWGALIHRLAPACITLFTVCTTPAGSGGAGRRKERPPTHAVVSHTARHAGRKQNQTESAPPRIASRPALPWPAGAIGRHRRGTGRAGRPRRRWRHGSEARARKSWGESQGAGPPAMMIRNPDQPGPDSPDPAAAAVTVSNVGGRAGQQGSRPQGGGCRELSTSLPWFATLHWHFEVRTRVRLRGLRTHCVRTARPSRHYALMTTLCSQLFLVFLYLLQ